MTPEQIAIAAGVLYVGPMIGGFIANKIYQDAFFEYADNKGYVDVPGINLKARDRMVALKNAAYITCPLYNLIAIPAALLSDHEKQYDKELQKQEQAGYITRKLSE